MKDNFCRCCQYFVYPTSYSFIWSVGPSILIKLLISIENMVMISINIILDIVHILTDELFLYIFVFTIKWFLFGILFAANKYRKIKASSTTDKISLFVCQWFSFVFVFLYNNTIIYTIYIILLFVVVYFIIHWFTEL